MQDLPDDVARHVVSRIDHARTLCNAYAVCRKLRMAIEWKRACHRFYPSTKLMPTTTDWYRRFVQFTLALPLPGLHLADLSFLVEMGPHAFRLEGRSVWKTGYGVGWAWPLPTAPPTSPGMMQIAITALRGSDICHFVRSVLWHDRDLLVDGGNASQSERLVFCDQSPDMTDCYGTRIDETLPVQGNVYLFPPGGDLQNERWTISLNIVKCDCVDQIRDPVVLPTNNALKALGDMRWISPPRSRSHVLHKREP